jgi:hypothetical protein
MNVQQILHKEKSRDPTIPRGRQLPATARHTTTASRVFALFWVAATGKGK